MQTQVQAYLFFDGRCEEALQYYSKHLGAKIEMLMRFKENPEPPPPGMKVPGDKVMHAAFRIGEPQLLASDGMASGNSTRRRRARSTALLSRRAPFACPIP